MLYSRPQLRVLLTLAAIFLAGFAVKQWQARFPETAQWLERLDREEIPGAAPVSGDLPPATIRKPDSTDQGSPPGETRSEPVRAPEADARPLDINRASVAELGRLPGVGPALAQRIVDERQRRGRFESPDALRRVVGIGPKKLAALRDLVTTAD
jgi:competence ComEA-like helix-hairpin-helix protein